MNNSIYPCLWFDGNAKEAAEFYCGVFENSSITTDTPMVVQFLLEGKKIMGLNGGPMFKINPSISFFMYCSSEKEISEKWNKLSEGGKIMMNLDKYPWAEKYGWTADKFGMTWQLMLNEIPNGGQKITPSFLFVGDVYGKGKSAVEFYTSLFPNSRINDMQLYQPGEPQPEGNLKFSSFSLNRETFNAMDGFGNHEFKFNEGLSLTVECESQEEIDFYWNKLTEEGEESRCGWLKDRFGVSWQIVPKVLGRLMSDPAKAQRVMQEVMKMKKLDIAVMENA